MEQGHDRLNYNQHEDNFQARMDADNRTPPSTINKSQTNSHSG